MKKKFNLENILYSIGKRKVDIDENKKKILINELLLAAEKPVNKKEVVATTNIKKAKNNNFTFGLGALAFTGVLASLFAVFYLLRPSPSVAPEDTSEKLYTFTGYVQKGPFISGSHITIQELDKKLNPTGRTFDVTTKSDFGDYEFSKKLRSPYIEVFAQGYYFNEVSGKLSDSPLTLSAVTSVAGKDTVNVNILTTLASDRIKYLVKEKGMDFRLARIKAEYEVLRVFNLADFSVSDFDNLDITRSELQDAVLIAVSAVTQGDLSVAQLSELTSKIALDLEKDGLVDGLSYVETLQENSKALSITEITENLTNRYADLGLDINVPPFEQFVKKLVEFRVITTNPEDGEDSVDKDAAIEILLSKEIDPSTITADSFYLSKGTKRVDAEITIDPDLRKITLVPSESLELSPSDESLPLVTYNVVLSRDIKSVDGEQFDEDYTYSFQTKRYEKLQVTTVSPENGAFNVSKDEVVAISFNHVLNQASINAHNVVVTKDDVVITGDLKYDSETLTIYFTPSGGWEMSPTKDSEALKKYTVTVGEGIVDTNDQHLLNEFTSAFTTVRLNPIAVTKVKPQADSTNQDPYTTISATFDKDIVPSSLNKDTFVIASSGGLVYGSITYNSQSREVTFTPSEPLTSDAEYMVTLKDSITATDGATFEQDYSWSFTTARLDITSDLIAYYPLDGNALDASGNNNNATAYNVQPTIGADGRDNHAYRLSGNGSKIEIPNAIDLNVGEWTYSFWFKVYGSGNMFLGGNLLGIASETDVLDIITLWQETNYYISSSHSNKNIYGITPNEWHNVTITQRLVSTVGDMKTYETYLYYDGIPYKGNLEASGIYSLSEPLTIGEMLLKPLNTRYSSSTGGHYGTLWSDVDNIRIYKRALNEFEVKELMKS